MSIHAKNKTQQIQNILGRGAEEIIDRDHMRSALEGKKILRVKFGIDPTMPDIHLGHTVPLWKVRQFQELGHVGVVIIGDYTAAIGDPSGKEITRPQLSIKEIKQNSAFYKKQILKILLRARTEFHYQSEWYRSFSLRDFLAIASKSSTSYLLGHETFRKRLEKEQPFMVHEFLYPLIQGYDSFAVKADIEVGALDQKFNMLTGRAMQKQAGMPPQDIIMTPYILGTDGVQKMSKSLNNYISLLDDSKTMYGKIMSIPDELIVPYFTCLTGLSQEELRKKNIEAKEHPREAKADLAYTLTEFYCGRKEAEAAEKEFQQVFVEHNLPPGIHTVSISETSVSPLDFLVALGLVGSKGEARRLIEQGGASIDAQRITDWKTPILPREGTIVRAGKRRFARVKIAR